MTKNLGNYIGIARTSTNSSAPGVWNMFHQFYWKKQDLWPKDMITGATGGTVSTPGDGYRYHVFTSPGDFTVSGTGSAKLDIANMFLVGGGDSGSNRGGGWEGGGGGGGGEVLNCNGPFKVKIETHSITIGPGGPDQSSSAPSNKGGSTSFADSSLGTLQTGYSGPGGMGVGEGPLPAASYPTYPTVAPLYGTVTPYKNAGGSGGPGAGRGGGGGGASTAGTPGPSGATGGSGTTIPWYPGTYGGGGGGGDAPLQGQPGAGAGGPGGGGGGRGGTGTANTGGGGGGSGSNPSPTPGGAGGSGILVLRYLISQIT